MTEKGIESGNRSEIAEKAERFSNNGKVSGTIPGLVAFAYGWFENNSAFLFLFCNNYG